MASSLRADLSLSARHTPVPTISATPSPGPPQAPGLPGSLPPPPTNSQIEAAIQKAQQMSARSTPDGRNSSLGRDTRMQLFVGNLPYRVRWQDLKDLFRKAGTVLRADVSLGPDNRSRGYGTVLFGNADDAARAVEMFNGYSWQSRTLEVRPDRLPPDFDAGMTASLSTSSNGSFTLGPSPLHAMPYIPPNMNIEDPVPSPMGSMFGVPRVPSASGRTLFVGNLPFHCQWQDLKDLFRQAGSVMRADVVLGPDGRSRGHGTVSFANDADAENAVKMFNGYEFNGRPLKVHYDKYTGQNTPAAMIGTSASPAPHMQSLPYPNAYSALPAYLTQAPGTIMMPPGSPFDHFASPPHSPYDPYPPSMIYATSASYTSTQRQSSTESPPRVTTSSSGSGQHQHSPPPLHIETHVPTLVQQHQQHQQQQQQQQHHHAQQQAQSHPAHPGPITLPPPPHGFPAPLSPQSTQIPPITPSMPSFSFVPQAPTPPLHAQFLSPGIGPFSPTLSPGGFFSPGGPHPFLNPAPGAPVHLQPVVMSHSIPHSPVSPHPPGSPSGAYFMYHPGDHGYFPPVGMHMQSMPGMTHPHPLAQEHTPPSDVADDAATVSQRTMVEESVLRRPSSTQLRTSSRTSPASVVTASEEGSTSKVGTSSPGTSLDDELQSIHSQPRPSVADTYRSVSDTVAGSTTASTSPQLHMDLPRAKSTGTGAAAPGSFAQAVRGAPAPIERPSHAYSSSVARVAQLENGLAALELGPTALTPNRDRRASWHVDSPSVENPRGGGSYFAALGYAD